MTCAGLPFTLSCDVLPSDDTSKRFSNKPTYSHSHVNTGWKVSILTAIRSSNADFKVLTNCSTDWTALSTMPTDPFEFSGGNSRIVRAPVLATLADQFQDHPCSTHSCGSFRRDHHSRLLAAVPLHSHEDRHPLTHLVPGEASVKVALRDPLDVRDLNCWIGIGVQKEKCDCRG